MQKTHLSMLTHVNHLPVDQTANAASSISKRSARVCQTILEVRLVVAQNV